MPIGITDDWGNGFPVENERYISVVEMHRRLAPLRLVPAESPHGNGPARTFTIPGALGTVGFISPLGEHFCASCNRLRLTADGALRPCLLIDCEILIRDALREGRDLAPHLKKAVQMKPKGHQLELLTTHRPTRAMNQIGG